MLLVAAAALMTACQKEDIADTTTPSVHFTINADMALSRTAITDNGDGSYTPTWQKNDKLAVFFGFPTEDNTKVNFTNTAADGATSSFEATVNDISDEQTLYAFYPASAFARNYDFNNTTGLNLVGLQSPTLSSFDPAADILVAKPKTVTVSGTDVTINDMAFARMISVAKVVLNDATTGKKLATEKVLSVKIVASSDEYPLAGRVRIDMDHAKIIDYTVKNPEVKAEYEVEDNFVVNGTNAAYLCVFPTTIPANETVKFLIETENYEITKSVELESDLVFPISNVATIKLNIQDSETVQKVAETRILVESFDGVDATKTQATADATGVKGTGVSENLTYSYSAANCNIRITGAGQTADNPYLYINAAGSSMTISKIAVSNETNLKFTAKVAQASSNKVDGYLTLRYKESSAETWNTAGIIASATSWSSAEASLGFSIANTVTSLDLQLEGDAVMLVDDIVLEAGNYTNPDILTVSETELNLSHTAGATATFEVFANKAWSLANSGSGFTVSPTSGNAYATTTVTVTASAAGGATDADLGAIAITAGGKNATVAVKQSATPAAGTKYYTEVTSDPGNWSGKYLLVYKTGSKVATGNLGSGGKLAATEIIIDAMNGIKYEAETTTPFEVTIEKTTNGYSIKNSNNQYISYSGNSTNISVSNTVSSMNNEWNISIKNGSVVICNAGATTRHIGWNNDNSFKAYTNTSTYEPAVLFKAPTE